MHRRLLHLSKHFLRPTYSTPTIKTTAAALRTSHIMAAPAITLYTAQTPNGIKISIALEELGLPYTVKKIDLAAGVQKEPWFLAINPNGRMPAITDTSFPDGKEINVFESGAILQYLVDTYDKDHKISYPKGSREDWEVQQWLFFQNAGLGPMQGQANHFFRYAPEKIPYAINRFKAEAERLYEVLETQLAASSSGFLVGDRLTIADITTWGWITIAPWSGLDMAKFPALQKWQQRLEQRPALKRGADVPEPSQIKRLLSDPVAAEEAAARAAKWIVQK